MNVGLTICKLRDLCRWLAVVGALGVLLSSVLPGCAGSGPQNRSHEFDPFGFPDEDSVVTAGAEQQSRSTRPHSDNTGPVVPTQAPEETKTIMRVQFYTTTSHSEAEDVLSRASTALNVPVVVEFDTPYYKLMAGPLPTREDADRLTMRLRAMGYEAAWVVREQASPTPKK